MHLGKDVDHAPPLRVTRHIINCKKFLSLKALKLLMLFSLTVFRKFSSRPFKDGGAEAGE